MRMQMLSSMRQERGRNWPSPIGKGQGKARLGPPNPDCGVQLARKEGVSVYEKLSSEANDAKDTEKWI